LHMAIRIGRCLLMSFKNVFQNWLVEAYTS
jgi:hypothetical protein